MYPGQPFIKQIVLSCVMDCYEQLYTVYPYMYTYYNIGSRPVARIFFGGVRSLERKGYFFFGGGEHPRVCKLIKLRKTVFASCNFF